MRYWNKDGFIGTIELTENSSRELLRVLEEQEQFFINELLDGKCGFTLRGSDGRTVDLVPKALGEWIPCSERLPEEEETYLISGKMKYEHEKEYETFIDFADFCREEMFPYKGKYGGHFSTFNDWYEGQQEYEILAWMPLPEIWEGSEE